MTRKEEVIKAIEIQFPTGKEGRTNEQALAAAGFELGVKWADEHPNLSSLWHNASEEPKGDDWKVLCQDKYGDYFIVAYNPYEIECDITWDEYTNSLFISKWIYITDILPKGGEE